MTKISVVISGGQTGADQGALEAALEKSVLCTGWCPRGRRAERGARIPRRFPVISLEDVEYPLRTLANVRSATATLVFTRGDRTVGTSKTIRMARDQKKPCLVVDLGVPGDDQAYVRIYRWLKRLDEDPASQSLILNVAGPRESKRPGIQDRVFRIMCEVLDAYGVKAARRVSKKLRTRG